MPEGITVSLFRYSVGSHEERISKVDLLATLETLFRTLFDRVKVSLS